MIQYVHKKGIEVDFVLIPFSPIVFEEQHAAYRDRVIAVEKRYGKLPQRTMSKYSVPTILEQAAWESLISSTASIPSQVP